WVKPAPGALAMSDVQKCVMTPTSRLSPPAAARGTLTVGAVPLDAVALASPFSGLASRPEASIRPAIVMPLLSISATLVTVTVQEPLDPATAYQMAVESVMPEAL